MTKDNETRQPEDHAQRLQALDPTQSIICEAPAGSGKTELLTQRLLTLLTRVKAPENIIAITFTKKAASEMRSRLLLALTKGSSPTPPTESHAQSTWQLAREVLKVDSALGWHLINNPNRLRIITFDSLNSTLANSLPFYSSFSLPPAISDNPQEDYQQAARALLASLEDEKPWSPAIAVLFKQLDNHYLRLENLLVDILDKRENWLPIIGAHAQSTEHEHTMLDLLEDSLSCIRYETIEKLKQLIPSQHQKTLLDIVIFAANNIIVSKPESAIATGTTIDVQSESLPSNNTKGIEQWQGIITLLLTDKNQWRKSLTKLQGFPPGEKSESAYFKEQKQKALALIESLKEIEGLETLLADCRYLPDEHYNQDQSELLSALTQLLPILSAYLSVTFKENSRVDFNEVSIKALMALGSLQETSELAMALDYQIQHLLVDEFQDTSPTQIDLLKKLTEGWQTNDARTLFCVGDAMQSIYSFRKAEVGLFIHALKHGLDSHLPLKPLRLTTNFRSQKPIIDWVNATFKQAFPAKNDIGEGAVSYQASSAFNHDEMHSSVTTYGFNPEHSELNEANTIARIIHRTREHNPQASIAILVSTRNHARHILPILKSEKIRFRAVELESLNDTSIVKDLLALTNALLYPGDRIAWLSILRAPWCGLSLKDLSSVSECAKHTPIIDIVIELSITNEDKINNTAKNGTLAAAINTLEKSLSSDGKLRLSRISPIIASAHHQRQRKTLRQWIEGAWINLGGPASLTQKTDLANATLFFTKLNQLNYHDVLATPSLLAKSMDSLYAEPDSEADESLQIMTIHKAKGLEFDTVIIPSLHKSARTPDKELLLWHNYIDQKGQRRLVIAPISTSASNTDNTYQYLSKQQQKREHFEACRKFYVACTRAKRKLYLLAEIKEDNKPPSKSSLLAYIWPSVKPTVQLIENSSDEPLAPANEPKPLIRLLSQWQLPELDKGYLLDDYIPYHEHHNTPTSANTTSNQEPNSADQNNSQVSDANELASQGASRHVGTLVHRLLHHFAVCGLASWNTEKIHQAQDQWKSALVNLGVQKNQLTHSLAKTTDIIEKIIVDEKIQTLLSHSNTVRKPEFSITQKTPAGYRQKIIDLLLIENDTTWIIDYKTSQPSATQSTLDFIAQEKNTYQEAMIGYKNAVALLGYSSIKMALYFPMIGEWAEYSGK